MVVGVGSILRNRYQLTQQIGKGGFSLIFSAVDHHRHSVGSTGPVVAIKLLKPEYRSTPGAAERLKREFARLEALSHPNIGHAFDLDRDGDVWFLVLEFFEGQPLSTKLSRLAGSPLPRASALQIIQACGEALEFAHKRGVLHCDFKPGNILVSPLEEVRVIDFGSGFDQYSSETTPPATGQPEHRQATPAYASPEALAGAPPDVRDDVYSFAAVAYELLTGTRPYTEVRQPGTLERMQPPDRPDGVDGNQWRLLSQALSQAQANRPLSLRPLLDAFKPRRRFSRAWLVVAALGGFAGMLLIGSALVGVDPRPLPESGEQLLLNETDNLLSTDQQTGSASATSSLPANDGIQVSKTLVEAGTLTSNSASTNQPRVAQETWITLDQPELRINRPTAMAAMIVQRGAGPERRARIHWRTIPGTALPGVDYTPVENGVVQFADNQNVSSLYVQLLNPTGVTVERTFYIEIRSGTDQVNVGPTARVAVTIGG